MSIPLTFAEATLGLICNQIPYALHLLELKANGPKTFFVQGVWGCLRHYLRNQCLRH